MNDGRIRNACITINNYDDTTLLSIKGYSGIRYAIYGKEICPTTGTQHIQGYIEFNQSIRFSTLKKLIPTAHIEDRKGSAQQAADYCKKEGNYEEHGTISKQGKRNDIHEVVEMLQEGASIRETGLTYPVQYIRYHKGIEKFKALLIEPRDEEPDIIVYYGPSGTGKSRTARKETTNPYIHHPQQGVWFDGYEGQKDVIFEEFRGQFPYGMLLSLTDRYDCKVQFKGGMIEFCAIKIIFTSPTHPRDWYPSLEGTDKIDQLLRRIKKIIKLT